MNTPAVIIRTDGTVLPCGLDYDEIKAGVGNIVDFQVINDVAGYFIDDEGMLNGSPLNMVASFIAGRAFYGNVVVVGPDTDDEGNTMPIAEQEFILFIIYTAERWAAVVASAARMGQDLRVVANPDTIPPPVVMSIPEGMDILEFLDAQAEQHRRGG